MAQCIRCLHEFAAERLSRGGRCSTCLEYAKRWQSHKYHNSPECRESHKRRVQERMCTDPDFRFR